MIRFLLGLRNARIATALGGHGGKTGTGWQLINGLGKGKLAVLPTGTRGLETLFRLDAYENQWFPIAQAALVSRLPALSARFPNESALDALSNLDRKSHA